MGINEVINCENVRLSENDKSVVIIDQTLLPSELRYISISTEKELYDAIYELKVRGAPAIGICAGYGLYVLAERIDADNSESFLEKLHNIKEYINSARPTAVNLSHALNRVERAALDNRDMGVEAMLSAMKTESVAIHNEDIAMCKSIPEYGLTLVKDGDGILTHCNAGALATVGYGTALSVVRSAYAKDNTIQVFADETRPRQQGARITTFELAMDGIPVTLITDGMCSYFMSKGMIDMVVVGADRIAANGDTANKIGTYTVAIAAKYHNVPFYIAAPLSTIDTSIKTGAEIPIQERSHEEVTHINGKRICAEGINVINPGFDVTPHELIAGIITEKGILRPDYNKSIAEAFLK